MASKRPASGKGSGAQYSATGVPPTARADAAQISVSARRDNVQFGGPSMGLLRANGRAIEIIEFEAAVVSFFIDATEILGAPKSVAAIYAICFASAEPLSFADIHRRLEMSQGSISQGLRVLREIGAIKIADNVPPSVLNRLVSINESKRRDYYTPDLELRKLALRFIEQRLEKQLNAGTRRLQAISAAIPPTRADAQKELNARLKYLESWYSKSQASIPLIKTFLKLG